MIWVEKYRPKELSEMVLPKSYRETFQKFIEMKSFPHLLFFGPPGTGKTTLARILIRKTGADYIELNASDERGIDTIREKIKNFVSAKSVNNKLKVVFLDEADALTKDAQQTLRNMMEKFYKTARFILTANFVHKIIDPLRSRCQMFEFKPLPKEFIRAKLIEILRKEHINFKESDIDYIISISHGDLRLAINYAQKYSYTGTLSITMSDFDKVYEMLNRKSIPELRQFFAEHAINWELLYRFLYTKAKRPENLLLISKYLWRHSIVADPEINFIGLAVEWVIE